MQEHNAFPIDLSALQVGFSSSNCHLSFPQLHGARDGKKKVFLNEVDPITTKERKGRIARTFYADENSY